MGLVPDLSDRRRQDEVMDDPALDSVRHRAALVGLGRVNRVSRTVDSLWPFVTRFCGDRPAKLLDVACGGGDIVLGLHRRAERQRVPLTVAGCDVSATALEFAAGRARRRQADLTFLQADVLNEPLPREYDILTCTLFLHHLEEPDALGLLGRMADAAELVLVSDLTRSRWGYLAAWAGSRLLSRSAVVYTDGPRSVRAAFTPAEARRLAERAGLTGATVTPCWPWRWLLTWERPDGRDDQRG